MNKKARPLLKLESLSLRYSKQDTPALQEVSMEIDKGELIALVGESGSGKSSLLRALTGLEDPYSGSISLDGQLLFGNAVNISPGKRKIGLVFQDYSLFPHLNVADNIAYGLQGEKEKRATAQSYLQLVGLENYEDRYPHELSGGEQQRVALARALAPQPEILLLDEPFSNLDEALKDRLREDLFRILKKTKTTSILVTHDIEDAMRVADRIAILQGGRLRQMDTPQRLYQHPADVYVAGFLGPINILSVEVNHQNEVHSEIGPLAIKLAEGQYQIGVRPEHWQIQPITPTSGIPAKIIDSYFLGAYTEIILQASNRRILVHVQFNEWQVGEEVGLALKQANQYCIIN